MLKEQLLLEKKVYELRCQLVELTELYNKGDDSQSLSDLRWQTHDKIQELEAERIRLANLVWPVERVREWLEAVTTTTEGRV